MVRRKEAQRIGRVFEEGFLRLPLQLQIEHCNHYELAPWFRKWLPGHQPILEAGCGSGRWVGWFQRQGWSAVGLDWSASLCERARRVLPGASFVAGDIRVLPWQDESFGSVVSLGAIEHAVEGPMPALLECRRVLKPGGIAIITVPYLGLIRVARRAAKWPVHLFKSAWRMLLPARREEGRSYQEMLRATNTAWAPDFMPDGRGWTFFQYNFTRRQMRDFLGCAGFCIEEEFVHFLDEGILHNFGRLAGVYLELEARVRFSGLGHILRRIIPIGLAGHMVCYVVTRNPRDLSRERNSNSQ